MQRSFQRLAAFERDELRMVRHVLKVMFVFSLMDRRRLAVDELGGYLESVPLYTDFNRRYLRLDPAALADLIVGELERAGAVRRMGGYLTCSLNARKKTGACDAPARKMRKNMARNCSGTSPFEVRSLVCRPIITYDPTGYC